jgi:mRNA interferase RelE/StbE
VHRIRILKAAANELSRLDKTVSRRIVQRVNWLAANLGRVRLEQLTGDLAGLYKLRVGDYRVVYEVLDEEQALVIHMIGHRRDIYRKR